MFPNKTARILIDRSTKYKSGDVFVFVDFKKTIATDLISHCHLTKTWHVFNYILVAM